MRSHECVEKTWSQVTSPMLCTQHLIITATRPYLTLKSLSLRTWNQQLSHQCHAPLHRVSTNYYCPTSKSISAHHGPPLPWPWGITWSKVPPHAASSSCSSIQPEQGDWADPPQRALRSITSLAWEAMSVLRKHEAKWLAQCCTSTLITHAIINNK